MHAQPNIAWRSSPPSRQMMLRVMILAFVAVSVLLLDSESSDANPTGTKLAVRVTTDSSAASAAGQNANEGSADSLKLFGARATVAAATSNIGLHDIVQGSVIASSKDALDFVDSNLMRAAATLTYVADSAAHAYDANTVLAASVSGFKPAQAGRGSTLQRDDRRCFPAHHGRRTSSDYIVGDAMWPLVGAPVDFGLIGSAATDPAGR